jgi:UPF0176 protein
MTIAVAAFYKFVAVGDCQALRAELLERLSALDMKGTILVAPEGINGTISGTPAAMDAFLGRLRRDPRFADLLTKDSGTDTHPFKRLKVKVKREIVTFGQPMTDPANAGTRVAPLAWNALIADPDVVVVDTRNAFEVAIGTFPGAINPNMRRFTDLPTFVEANLDPARHRKIAMFCTGGIRCEKATAYVKARGFSEVYHLQGGILAYLAQVPREQSEFVGDCFVFDERWSVTSDKL